MAHSRSAIVAEYLGRPSQPLADLAVSSLPPGVSDMGFAADTARLKRAMLAGLASDYVTNLLRAVDQVADYELDGAIECLLRMRCAPEIGRFGLYGSGGNGSGTAFVGIPHEPALNSVCPGVGFGFGVGSGFGMKSRQAGLDTQTRVEGLGRPGSGAYDEMCGHHPVTSGVIDLTAEDD